MLAPLAGDHSASCERPESRADVRRNDERTRFMFAKSDDDVSFQRDVREKRRKLGLQAEFGHAAGVVLDQS